MSVTKIHCMKPNALGKPLVSGRLIFQGIFLGVLGAAWPAMAQTVIPPGVGQLLQENRPRPPKPAPSPALPDSASAPDNAATLAPDGGPRVLLRGVQVQDISGLDMAQLVAATGLDQMAGQSLDLAGLRELAQRVSAYLQAHGYLVARAWLPAQDLSNGVLQIHILQGHYGQVLAQSADASIAAASQHWLEPLQQGQVIQKDSLHRRLLLLSDLQGMKFQSMLRPGSLAGEADLVVNVEPARPWKARLGVDNHGNRYAGRERITAGLDWQPGWVFGDQFNVELLRTTERTWQAVAGYSLPLGVNGWRLQTMLSHTDYQLGKEFAALDAHGTANTVMLGLSYPLLRTQTINVRASGGWQHRVLRDMRDVIPSADRKTTQATQLSLSADWQQAQAVTWGSLNLNAGQLRLYDSSRRLDSLTAKAAGHYTRLNLDAARIQYLGTNWSVYGRMSTQWANKNLDDSEKMVLGGASGVRAWPSGEAIGDRGWLTQLELRWNVRPGWQAYAFVDAGAVHLNSAPWTDRDNRRTIAGRGLGVRYEARPIKVDLAVARRNGSAASQADPDAERTRVWLSASYQF